jgi:tetratricopeptide (TPR) repeat protein
MSAQECYAEGVELAERGETGAAIQALEKAVELNPDDADACKLPARLSPKIHEERAFANWRHEASRTGPDDTEPHQMMADAIEAAGRLEEAEEARQAAAPRMARGWSSAAVRLRRD